MPAKLRHDGKVHKYLAAATHAPGDLVSLRANDEMVGVVMQDMVSGDEADVSVCGVYEITKSSATDTGSAGKLVSISVSGDTVDVTPSANATHRLAADTANGDTTALVFINAQG